MIDLRALDGEFRVIGDARAVDEAMAEATVRAAFASDDARVIAHVEWWAWDMPGQVLWHRLVTRGEEVSE